MTNLNAMFGFFRLFYDRLQKVVLISVNCLRLLVLGFA